MKITATHQSFYTRNIGKPLAFKKSKEEREEEEKNFKEFCKDMWNVGILSLPIVSLPFAFAPSSCFSSVQRDSYQKTIQQQKITQSNADNLYKTEKSDFVSDDILPENEKPEPILTEEKTQAINSELREYPNQQKLDAKKDSIEQRKFFVERFKTIDTDDGLTISEAEFREYLAKKPDKFDREKFQKYAGKDRELNINEFINMYKKLPIEEK